jgi:hypothetical protein
VCLGWCVLQWLRLYSGNLGRAENAYRRLTFTRSPTLTLPLTSEQAVCLGWCVLQWLRLYSGNLGRAENAYRRLTFTRRPTLPLPLPLT